MFFDIIFFMISRMENTITAKSSMEQLPDDTHTLKQMILTLLSRIDDLNGQLIYLKRQLFGRKSEKLDPAQRLLFENLYAEVQEKIRCPASSFFSFSVSYNSLSSCFIMVINQLVGVPLGEQI